MNSQYVITVLLFRYSLRVLTGLCDAMQGIGGIKWLGRKVVTAVEPCGDYYLAEALTISSILEKGGRFGITTVCCQGLH